MFKILITIAVASVLVRMLVEYEFEKSALLNVGFPLLIALVLIYTRHPNPHASWKKRHVNRMVDGLIILFGASVVLHEVYLCVLMFIPIYLTIILFVFIFDVLRRSAKSKGRGTLELNLIPLVLLALAFEGVTPETSFSRSERISATRHIDLSVAEIQENLRQPIDLKNDRSWILSLFPMPYLINSNSMSQGAVHEIRFEYYRWFFTNKHDGRMLLEMTVVNDAQIRTTFLEDTTYISNYMKLNGTEITMDAIDPDQTRVSLTIAYERILDPHWYFGPLQRYSIRKMGEFLLDEIFERNVEVASASSG